MPQTEQPNVTRVYFHDVEISIPGSDPVKAYEVVCDALAQIGEFTTDTYSTDADPEEKDTSELWLDE